MSQKILKWLIDADIWLMFNILGGRPGETISAAAWNAWITKRWWFGWTHFVIDVLFLPWMTQHCRKDWEYRKDIYK